ncbi:hypothetical protein WJX73_000393 [Symbiochloris irregularis]|uniref:Uncharacterized protein n=1 Tax=Symbiochloris irregularis TaxID=706552 RepID=A0AAW1NRM2_9CHLO
MLRASRCCFAAREGARVSSVTVLCSTRSVTQQLSSLRSGNKPVLAQPCRLHISRHSLLVLPQSRKQLTCFAAASAAAPSPQSVALPVSAPAKRSLERTADACRRIGWISFWSQLSLSVVSAGILLFSVAFTSVNGPGATLYLTLFGIAASFLSTFWAYGLTRLSRQLRIYADKGPKGTGRRITKAEVRARLWRSAGINLAGIASTLLGLQATVGLLVAKTLTNATANPFLSGGSGSYNPVLALDVFLVQASTNTLFAHFASLLFYLWLIKVVGEPGEGTQTAWPTTASA